MQWFRVNMLSAARSWARLRSIPSRCVAADVVRAPGSWVHTLDAKLLHMGVSHQASWGVSRGASQSVIRRWLRHARIVLACLSLACQLFVLNSSPRNRDLTRLCAMAAAPQFAFLSPARRTAQKKRFLAPPQSHARTNRALEIANKVCVAQISTTHQLPHNCPTQSVCSITFHMRRRQSTTCCWIV